MMDTSVNRSEMISGPRLSSVFMSLIWVAACREIQHRRIETFGATPAFIRCNGCLKVSCSGKHKSNKHRLDLNHQWVWLLLLHWNLLVACPELLWLSWSGL